MTAPDHRPYLLETDLRTAEDVLAWQADCVLAWVPEHSDGRMPAGSLVQLLAARLERERRQACRRGARREWRKMRICARRTPEWVASGWVQADHGEWQKAFDALTRALAFRAAASAK